MLNEGLEVLGTDERYDGTTLLFGVFWESALEKVEFSSTLKKIERKTFGRCENLKSVRLPDGLEKIGACCFYKSSLEKVVLPASVKEVGAEAFESCEHLKSVRLNDDLEKLGCEEDSSDTEGEVFSGCAIESIRLSSMLKRIEKEMFCDCKYLKSIKLPDSVECIGEGCFKASELEEIELPCTLREIGEKAFKGCENLKTVWVEDGCRADLSEVGVPDTAKIGPFFGTFVMGTRVWDLRGLKAVVIPDGAEFIGSYWFYRCEIESVEIPASVREIGVEAFFGCEELEKLVFRGATDTEESSGSQECSSHSKEKSQLRVIDTSAFYACHSLKEVRLPDSLIQIGLNAFGWTGLERVTVPASVRIIHQGAFGECEDLTEVTLNEGLEVLGTEEYTKDGELQTGAFQYTALERVELPSTLRRIEGNTFGNCEGLASVELPKGLEYIGPQCFSESGLESVAFPPALKVIENGAFRECGNLKNVEFSEGLERIGR